MVNRRRTNGTTVLENATPRQLPCRNFYYDLSGNPQTAINPHAMVIARRTDFWL
ncbi:hypothetical protein NDA00_25880 [Funiculus sociatus GB2-M2]|uniref:hypothetical protein n=1 Tax=Funiculus sociatus TaxID=450527 RepID=UPI00329A7E9D